MQARCDAKPFDPCHYYSHHLMVLLLPQKNHHCLPMSKHVRDVFLLPKLSLCHQAALILATLLPASPFGINHLHWVLHLWLFFVPTKTIQFHFPSLPLKPIPIWSVPQIKAIPFVDKPPYRAKPAWAV